MFNQTDKKRGRKEEKQIGRETDRQVKRKVNGYADRDTDIVTYSKLQVYNLN